MALAKPQVILALVFSLSGLAVIGLTWWWIWVAAATQSSTATFLVGVAATFLAPIGYGALQAAWRQLRPPDDALRSQAESLEEIARDLQNTARQLAAANNAFSAESAERKLEFIQAELAQTHPNSGDQGESSLSRSDGAWDEALRLAADSVASLAIGRTIPGMVIEVTSQLLKRRRAKAGSSH